MSSQRKLFFQLILNSMATSFNLFRSYNPLVKCGTLFVREDEVTQRSFGIRPVWIIGDLEILNDWMLSPLKKSNWEIDPKNSSVFRYYKAILLSSNAQSFVIEQDKKPVIQFDILPVPKKQWPSVLSYSVDDYCLNFLFRESFRNPDIFWRGLSCLTEYINSVSGIRFLYVKLLNPERQLDDYLIDSGFQRLDAVNFYGKTIHLYRISLVKATDYTGQT